MLDTQINEGVELVYQQKRELQEKDVHSLLPFVTLFSVIDKPPRPAQPSISYLVLLETSRTLIKISQTNIVLQTNKNHGTGHYSKGHNLYRLLF